MRSDAHLSARLHRAPAPRACTARLHRAPGRPAAADDGRPARCSGAEHEPPRTSWMERWSGRVDARSSTEPERFSVCTCAPGTPQATLWAFEPWSPPAVPRRSRPDPDWRRSAPRHARRDVGRYLRNRRTAVAHAIGAVSPSAGALEHSLRLARSPAPHVPAVVADTPRDRECATIDDASKSCPFLAVQGATRTCIQNADLSDPVAAGRHEPAAPDRCKCVDVKGVGGQGHEREHVQLVRGVS